MFGDTEESDDTKAILTPAAEGALSDLFRDLTPPEVTPDKASHVKNMTARILKV